MWTLCHTTNESTPLQRNACQRKHKITACPFKLSSDGNILTSTAAQLSAFRGTANSRRMQCRLWVSDRMWIVFLTRFSFRRFSESHYQLLSWEHFSTFLSFLLSLLTFIFLNLLKQFIHFRNFDPFLLLSVPRVHKCKIPPPQILLIPKLMMC